MSELLFNTPGKTSETVTVRLVPGYNCENENASIVFHGDMLRDVCFVVSDGTNRGPQLPDFPEAPEIPTRITSHIAAHRNSGAIGGTYYENALRELNSNPLPPGR